MNETIYDRLKRHEGCRLHVYLDTRGNPTIGFGHKLSPAEVDKYSGGITAEQADYLLDADVRVFRARVADLLPWSTALDPLRQDVVVEMAFQMGTEGLLGFHNFLYCLRSGDHVGAARAMLEGDTPTGMSAWYNETPRRCAELAGLMEAA